MKFIELHDIGYGECIVFEGKSNEVMMIDCGSMNLNIKYNGMKFKDYVLKIIMPRYEDASQKNFLLTHFHRDHICGLKYILKQEKSYFDKIYIPYPCVNNENRALLLEMAIYLFVFMIRQQSSARSSTSALFIFEFLRKNSTAQILPIKKGDFFEFSGVKYTILNPNYKNFEFSKEFIEIIKSLDNMMESINENNYANRFFYLKKLFCDEYINCCELCAKYKSLENDYVKNSIYKLNSLVIKLNELSNEIKELNATREIIKFLNSEYVNMTYSMEQNATSVVFQNDKQNLTNCNDIIMTGDVTPKILDSLENELFKFYNIIKVPHHGTDSYQSMVLNKIPCSHLLVSNGEYCAGGRISKLISENNAIKHCTDMKNCHYFKKNNSCCNRTNFCNSLKIGGDLSLHCDKKTNSTGLNKCGIYIVSADSNRGCYCD